ncbi:unnamed protein product, partial [Linum tenue]
RNSNWGRYLGTAVSHRWLVAIASPEIREMTACFRRRMRSANNEFKQSCR